MSIHYDIYYIVIKWFKYHNIKNCILHISTVLNSGIMALRVAKCWYCETEDYEHKFCSYQQQYSNAEHFPVYGVATEEIEKYYE